jgi:hypothetical protein
MYKGMKVSEEIVLRRICGPKREKVTGEQRKLHNEELRNLYPSPDIKHINMNRSKVTRYSGHRIA